MMLNKGKHGSERILSRPSIELMTTNQLTPAEKAASPFADLSENHGWGFGVPVVTRRDGVAASPGRHGWDGGFGTTWSSDPAEDLVAILMTQRVAFDILARLPRLLDIGLPGDRRLMRQSIANLANCFHVPGKEKRLKDSRSQDNLESHPPGRQVAGENFLASFRGKLL